MTLNEAIKHAEEVAGTNERLCETVHQAMQLSDYGKCAKEHRQLAEWLKELKQLKEQEPCEDAISRQAAIDTLHMDTSIIPYKKAREYVDATILEIRNRLEKLPSAQPEQRYTEEELRVFAHGISLSLLSKRSAQHWRYDEDTATEIKFLERLYEKVGADMRGEKEP